MTVSEDIAVDALTGLPYDRYFIEKAPDLIKNVLKNPVMISLDISNFKYFNQMYGFEEGDKLLKRMADKYCHNDNDCVLAYRIYIDHIILLVDSANDDCRLLMDKYDTLNREFGEEINKEFNLSRVRFYTGAYVIKDRNEYIGKIIDKAQLARRSIKTNYLFNMAFFAEGMDTKAEIEASIIPTFFSALENDRIEVYIQPKFSIEDQKLIGGEALSRIIDKEGNIIPPYSYIDILEKSKLISYLDDYVIRKLVDIQKRWLEEGREIVTVSLNLSIADLLEPGFINNVHEYIVKSGVPVKYFEFELTETIFCENVVAVTKQIEYLKEKGYKISMDDFGSGYNSLYMLGKVPVDVIKFDRGFVLNSLPSTSGRKIMKNLVNTFDDINLGVICEGIENREEEQLVYECGCNAIQGYLHDKPIPYYVFADKYLNKQQDL